MGTEVYNDYDSVAVISITKDELKGMMTGNRTNEQTAMERFRALLEKRGVEFETNDDECAEGEERITVFKANLGESEFDIFVTAKDWYFDGKLTPWLDVEFHNTLTPEQAVVATLGCEQELIDLAHNAWSMALCAMQGMPIPAEWGNAVEHGLRKYGINVDEELTGFEVTDE